MNHNEISDWRNIAHTEYEKRKGIELRLERTSHALEALKQTLTTSTNYSALLEKQLAELESKGAEQEAKLGRSIDLLKNAKLLIARRKNELENLLRDNSTLKTDNVALKDENIALHKDNAELRSEFTKLLARLEAEELQHEKTNHKLAQSLSKLATAAVMMNPTVKPSLSTPPRRVTSPDVIYAEAGPQEPEFAATKKESLIRKLFFALAPEESTKSEEPDTDFIEQVLYIEKQYK